MSDGYGSEARPVPHDPMSRIVEVNFVSRADIIIIRSGNNLPDGTTGLGRNAVFAPGAPGTDTERDPVEQADAHLDQFYVGGFTDATNVDPDPPTAQFYRDTPFRLGGANNVQIPVLTFPDFNLITPSSTQWGNRADNYNAQGMYLWHAGKSQEHGGVQCCLINARKMTYDFMERGNKALAPDNPGYRDVKPTSMSMTVYFQGTFPAGTDNMMVEFAAYKIIDPDSSGDFFVIDNGAVYANDVRKIARRVVRISPVVLLPSVTFTYNFKGGAAAEITSSGDDGELTEAELLPFEQQPGG